MKTQQLFASCSLVSNALGPNMSRHPLAYQWRVPLLACFRLRAAAVCIFALTCIGCLTTQKDCSAFLGSDFVYMICSIFLFPFSFDLIYLMLDKYDEGRDRRLARHLVSLFHPGAADKSKAGEGVSGEASIQYLHSASMDGLGSCWLLLLSFMLMHAANGARAALPACTSPCKKCSTAPYTTQVSRPTNTGITMCMLRLNTSCHHVHAGADRARAAQALHCLRACSRAAAPDRRSRCRSDRQVHHDAAGWAGAQGV